MTQTTPEGTDWMWCYENPKEAAAEIDRLMDWLRYMAVDDPDAQRALDGERRP